VLKKPDLKRFAEQVDTAQERRVAWQKKKLVPTEPGFIARLYMNNPKKFMFCAGFGWMGFLLGTPLYATLVQPVVDLGVEFKEWATREN